VGEQARSNPVRVAGSGEGGRAAALGLLLLLDLGEQLFDALADVGARAAR